MALAGAILAVFGCAFARTAPAQEPLQVQGSATVAGIVTQSLPALRKEAGVEAKVSTQGGSTGGILAIGSEQADLGMSTRAITGSDRAAFPGVSYKEYRLGIQAMVLVVPRDLWNGGVRALSREQMLSIYEQDVKNWKELGGPDQAIKFYNTEQGQGAWELLAEWLYGDLRRAPLGTKFEKVATGEETRNIVEFNRGSLAVVAPKWVDGKNVFALGLKTESGGVIEPIPENLMNGTYPLARPLLLIAGDRPTGHLKDMLEFMFSETGQQIVEKAGAIPQSKLGELPTF